MNIRILVLMFVLVSCALLARAQRPPLRADELPDAPQATVSTLADNTAPPDFSELAARLPLPAPAPMLVAATPQPPRPKLLDKKFLALGLLVFGLTALDVETTQHCLQRGICEELNPTLPRSHWGMYAVNTPVNVAVMYFSYRRRRSGKWGWWLAPLVDIGAHTAGVGSNIRWVK